MLRSKATLWIASLLLAVFAVASTGCGEKDPGPSEQTQQESDRLTKIQQSSGGDWEKVSAEDKEYLINTLGHGNENTAKMLLGPPKPATPGQHRQPGGQ